MKIELEGKVYDLDIDQAKKLNLLKERDTTCKSWGELCKKYLYRHGYRGTSSTVGPIYTEDQLTQDEALALAAFSKLLKLRRDWIREWNPDWSNTKHKYCIIASSEHFIIAPYCWEHRTFSFPTKEMAKEFLECFKDLFEQCKNII